MSRRLAAVSLALAVVGATGCGAGGRNAQEVVDQAASSLSTVRSGTLDVRLLVTPRGVAGGAFGLRLAGPFAFSTSRRLPIARIRYTQIAGGRQGSATVISTGSAAFVETAGNAYRLSPAQMTLLSGITGSKGGSLGALNLHFSRWLRNPKLGDGGLVGGVRTDRVTGRINASSALADLLAATHGADASPGVAPRTAKRLDAAVRASSVTLWTGKKDRFLRRLPVRLDLSVPSDLRSLTGGMHAVHLARRESRAHQSPGTRQRAGIPAPSGGTQRRRAEHHLRQLLGLSPCAPVVALKCSSVCARSSDPVS